MKDVVYDASALIEGFRKIGALRLKDELKARIRRTFVKTIVRRRYDSHAMTANVVGFKTKFCSFQSLAYLFEEIFLDQQYHFDAIKTNPYIVDCGSNIGMSILYFKMIYPDCEILAFEPEERAFACLVANVKANQLHSVQLNQKALTSTEGQVVLFIDPDDLGSLRASTVRVPPLKQQQEVHGTRLSPYIDRRVDFLKIDVEGGEVALLDDLAAQGKLTQIREMVLEFHHHIDPASDCLSHVFQLLERGGFGYQVRACPKQGHKPQDFQDILIHAYQKSE
jgi:FkbM family methyltransferase